MRSRSQTLAVLSILAVASCHELTDEKPSSAPREDDQLGPKKARITYGDFNVHAASDAPERRRDLAESIAIVVRREVEYKDGKVSSTTLRALNGEPLCEANPYHGQPSLDQKAFTATRVGSNVLLTAWHALCGSVPEQECKRWYAEESRRFRVIFGWGGPGGDISEDDVYTVTGICATGKGGDDDDWALIQVRPGFLAQWTPNTPRPPIAASHPSIEKFRTPEAGDEIFAFAHPFGTRMKYADCAKVRTIVGSSARTTLDAVRGFSGAPMFGEHNGEAYFVAVHKASRDLLPQEITVAAQCGSSIVGAQASTEECCALHGALWDREKCGEVPTGSACGENARVCCDDFRVVVENPSGGQPGVGECSGDSARATSRATTCRPLPVCREEGCCQSDYDSRGPIYEAGSKLDDKIKEYRDGALSCDYESSTAPTD